MVMEYKMDGVKMREKVLGNEKPHKVMIAGPLVWKEKQESQEDEVFFVEDNPSTHTVDLIIVSFLHYPLMEMPGHVLLSHIFQESDERPASKGSPQKAAASSKTDIANCTADVVVAGVNATLASQTSILKATTQSPCHEKEGEGDPSGREGSWTKGATCRYFMNGFCREEDSCQYSHGLSKDPGSMVCSNHQGTHEDCGRNENQEPQVNPKLPPPPSQSFPPLTDPLVDSNIGAVKPLNDKFEAIGASTDDWVYAIEFVPGQPYYGRFAHPCSEGSQKDHIIEEDFRGSVMAKEPEKSKVEECPYEESPSMFLDEDSCDLCGLQVSNTEDATQRLRHIRTCIEAHENDVELAFAVQRSQHLVCGICREVIYKKANPSEGRFGILSNCSHTFCLKCIRQWRGTEQFESKIKSCPECQVTSNFVIPSEFWVEEQEEKQKLIEKYKEAMSNEPCRYFDGGRGNCPFGSNCFYKHDYLEEEPHHFAKEI
ncbi:probable E3 ubiquitin-protein ligase makorin-1 [Gracilinanus agilis]|uniref:probable E3 ubiquitin-protein ligase makorin-1 n=1 Tax=Gracilinanus agilis TaxID=191870 RepID=UPI001CFDE51E|nr:probable E3 ubiquitin-protein ligase makorin-1 [Gracilinanus agilis]